MYRADKNCHPEQLLVVIIGSPEWDAVGTNDFTHVDMNDLDLGRKAENLLLSQIKSEESIPFQHFIQNCPVGGGSPVCNISQRREGW